MKPICRRQFIHISSVAAVTAFLPLRAHASATLLTVGGDISGQNPRSFTDNDLSELKQIEFSTSTIWTNTKAKFAGPPLQGLLDEVGAGPGSLRLRAVNDYMVVMPRDHIEAAAPIIANRIDGRPYNIRNKGPLWLVFPYDTHTRFQSEEVYAFSIWQLTHIEILAD